MIIQENNIRLENNNTNLNEIYNAINNLPTLKLQDKSVTPTMEQQIITADESYTGLSSVSVGAIEDENLVPENIKNDVEILGVKGSFLGEKYKPRYTYQPISFRNYTGTELDHETTMLDTTYFTKMDDIFYGCSNLLELNVNHWNVSNVQSLSNAFNGIGVKKLNLSNWDTTKVTSANMCFFSAQVEELDLSGWVTTNMSNMNGMFYLCQKLKYLDIRNFTFDNVTSYGNIFTFVPANCLIIVKGQTEKDWVLARRSDLTNVKTVAELGE